jgi:hypothetical protein
MVSSAGLSSDESRAAGFELLHGSEGCLERCTYTWWISLASSVSSIIQVQRFDFGVVVWSSKDSEHAIKSER